MAELATYNLWGEKFAIPSSEERTKKVLDKIKAPKELTVEKRINSKKTSVEDKLQLIEAEVLKKLDRRKDSIVVIESFDQLHAYIDAAIGNGIIAVDTETNKSLDPLTCVLMGPCIYTYGQKAAYIPLHHRDYKTGVEWNWQLTEQDIKREFQRLVDAQVKFVWHNYKFDYKVIGCTCDIWLPVDWDTQVAAKLIDENESAKLKDQYSLHIDPDQESYSIEEFFKTVEYADVPPKLFALYAALDAQDTLDLYDWQYPILTSMDEVYKVFKDIELPILGVTAKMELTGIAIDSEYAQKLSAVYHKQDEELQLKINTELEKLKPTIDAWRLGVEANKKQTGRTGKLGKSKSEQLMDPPDLGSPTQLSILLYDVMKVPVVDEENPRGTGEEVLVGLADDYRLCKLMLERRENSKLLTTFIDKLPELINPKTGRLHSNFNSTGTKTGRFSSTNPNLQQIPSHNKVVRMMFRADPGYSIVGADYSAQEVRVIASLANDKEMIRAYEENMDLYALIGTKIYHNEYADNLEFHPDSHELQPEGKTRRQKSKSFLLGLNYGMSDQGLAERLHVSLEEAKKTKEDFYKGFTGLKAFTEASRDMARTLGYVTTKLGRRRHLPDAQLPDYTIISLAPQAAQFNPLLGVKSDRISKETQQLVESYRERLKEAKYYKDVQKIKEEAAQNQVEITSNRSIINRALRQCINSQAQGTAAEMTKLAMIKVDRDPLMKKLKFQLLVTVHDEMFGQCPRENSQAAAARLSELMNEAAVELCPNVPWKSDGYCLSRWYEDEVSGQLREDYDKLLSKGVASEEAVKIVQDNYGMIKPEYAEQMCKDVYEVNVHGDI